MNPNSYFPTSYNSRRNYHIKLEVKSINREYALVYVSSENSPTSSPTSSTVSIFEVMLQILSTLFAAFLSEMFSVIGRL